MISRLNRFADKEAEDTEIDAVRYVFLARMVNFMATQLRTQVIYELLPKVLSIEEVIGYADAAPTFIQKYLLREKQLFYIFYSPHA